MFLRLHKLFGFESRLARRERLRGYARPAVELLEDRLAPASFTYSVPAGNVSVTGSGTTGGLLWAINKANSDHHTDTDTINLAANSTYILITPVTPAPADGPTGLPTITSAITITGKGATIRRGTVVTPAFRLFDVSQGASLTLKNLTLR